MSGDDEGQAFRLDLHVPGPELSDDDRRQAIEWLEQLASQLARHDGKKLAIQVTGMYDEDGGYPPEREDESKRQGGSDDPPPAQPACSARTAIVNIMVCPGRRPYT